MRPLLLSTSLAALLLAGSPALAQDEGMAPGGEGGAPAGATAPAPGADGMDGAPSAPGITDSGPDGASEMQRPTGRDATEGPQAREPSEAVEERGDTADSDGRRERGDGRGERRDRADDDRARTRDRADDETGRADRDERKAAEEARDDDDSAATGRSDGTEDSPAPSGSVTELSGEERTKVQSAFRPHKSEARVRDLDIEINVGVAVPGDVTLYAVPEEVIVLVPDYRRYKYFVFEDTVVIVDPDTLAIVDVLVLA